MNIAGGFVTDRRVTSGVDLVDVGMYSGVQRIKTRVLGCSSGSATTRVSGCFLDAEEIFGLGWETNNPVCVHGPVWQDHAVTIQNVVGRTDRNV